MAQGQTVREDFESGLLDNIEYINNIEYNEYSNIVNKTFELEVHISGSSQSNDKFKSEVSFQYLPVIFPLYSSTYLSEFDFENYDKIENIKYSLDYTSNIGETGSEEDIGLIIGISTGSNIIDNGGYGYFINPNYTIPDCQCMTEPRSEVFLNEIIGSNDSRSLSGNFGYFPDMLTFQSGSGFFTIHSYKTLTYLKLHTDFIDITENLITSDKVNVFFQLYVMAYSHDPEIIWNSEGSVNLNLTIEQDQGYYDFLTNDTINPVPVPVEDTNINSTNSTNTRNSVNPIIVPGFELVYSFGIIIFVFIRKSKVKK